MLISEPFKAFLNKELSVTSRHGVAPMRPQRIHSAKGRLETSSDANQAKEFAWRLNLNGPDDGSSAAKSTHSSGIKKIHRRPSSAVSCKSKLLVEDKKKQRPKKNTSNHLKAKADLFDDSVDIFKFEIQGASIQNSSLRHADNSEESSHSKTSNFAADEYAGCDNNVEEQPKSSLLWSSLMQSETSDPAKEPCMPISNGCPSCFLTAMRDEIEDDSETVHVHVPGDPQPRGRRKRSSGSRGLRHISAKKNGWFSVKPSVYNLELKEESPDRSNVRKNDGDFPYKVSRQQKVETSLVPVVSDLVADVPWKSHLGR